MRYRRLSYRYAMVVRSGQTWPFADIWQSDRLRLLVQPRWRPDGKELFYLSQDRKLMAVPIRGGSTIELGSPQALFEISFPPMGSIQPYAWYEYDVTADGQRFLINLPTESTTVPITVVLNWAAGLKR